MRSSRLGSSDLVVSHVGLGTMNFGGRCDPATSHDILDIAVEAGVRLIDTANVYGHDPADFSTGRGRCEAIIGDWVRRRGRHDDVVIGTKVFFPMRDDADAIGATSANVIRECEASLRRLGVDHIDLYQLHHPSNDIPVDETMTALHRLVESGKVRYVGTSTFSAWQLVETAWIADRLSLTAPVSEQCVYNLLDRRIERELHGMTATYGIGLLTWSPLAGGALAGVYHRGVSAPPGSRFDAFWTGREADLTPDAHDVIDVVTRLAAERGMSPATFAQAWVMGRPEPDSVLIGPRTIAQLEAGLTASTAELDTDALAAIDRVAPPGRCVLPQYGSDGLAWHSWGPHASPWPRRWATGGRM